MSEHEASRNWIIELFENHRGLLKSMIGRIIRNKYDASSIVQEVALRLCEGEIARIPANDVERNGFLRTVVSHAVAQYYRDRDRKKRRPQSGFETLYDDAVAVESATQETRLNEMLEALGDNTLRQIAFLRGIFGCTLAETSDELKLSVYQIRTKQLEIDQIWNDLGY